MNAVAGATASLIAWSMLAKALAGDNISSRPLSKKCFTLCLVLIFAIDASPLFCFT
jgi:hypothetical protein